MTRTFIEVPLFSKRWKEIGLGEDELRALQIMLLKDPVSGPIWKELVEFARSDFLSKIEVKVVAYEFVILILRSMK